jgi:hypothetical protein
MQTSNLYKRVTLVVMRVLLINFVNLSSFWQSVFYYLFILIFVGGLLILLVRVSSIQPPEPPISLYFRGSGVLLMTTFVFMCRWNFKRIRNHFLGFLRFDSFEETETLITFLIVLLMLELFIITRFFFYIEGTLRKC